MYRGKGISDSHDLSTFRSLYDGKSWNRDTGMILELLYYHAHCIIIVPENLIVLEVRRKDCPVVYFFKVQKVMQHIMGFT